MAQNRSHDEAVTVLLHGYFSQQHSGSRRRFTLPLAEAATPRIVIARLAVPPGAVGLLLINKQQAGMDSALHAGDTLDILPLLGGG